MRKVKIITDSCADLDGKQLEKYDIGYAKMSTFCDGAETPASLTWTVGEAHAFYEIMRGGKRITTAQVSTQEFRTVFDKYLAAGFDIVYIACSAKQSGSVNTGHVVAEQLLEEYPDAKIVCIDSENASIGEGMLAIEAAKLATSGKSVEEIAAHIAAVRKTVRQYATVHSLDALRRAGRVSASSAFFGNVMGVKPILIADADGAQVAFKKVRGRHTSLIEIVNLLKESITDGENATVYIAHADCTDPEVETLVQLVKTKIGCKEVNVGYIGPIVGASIGPDAIGVWAFGEPVTFRARS